MTNELAMHPQDIKFMQRAMVLAQKAEQINEIPVGAVLVHDGVIVGEGFNQSITLNDPTAHAEVMAIRDAATKLQNYRLIDCTLYVTLEPCVMCCGALIHSRIGKVVYGASDYKTGAVGSVMELLKHDSHNHSVAAQGGVLAEECGQLLSDFFARRRKEKKALKLEKKQTAN
jgi:tRNA(adenine34) deaminase